MGRKLIPKEVRDFNDLRDQLIDALQKKNTVQEEMIAAQDELIAQLTEEIQTFKETLRVVRIFAEKNMALLYLFIERYQISTIKEIASFAKGLQKDIEAVENAVAIEKSNGFVESTNSRFKMIKRTMYGRCSRQLLSAKLMYKKCCTT